MLLLCPTSLGAGEPAVVTRDPYRSRSCHQETKYVDPLQPTLGAEDAPKGLWEIWNPVVSSRTPEAEIRAP